MLIYQSIFRQTTEVVLTAIYTLLSIYLSIFLSIYYLDTPNVRGWCSQLSTPIYLSFYISTRRYIVYTYILSYTKYTQVVFKSTYSLHLSTYISIYLLSIYLLNRYTQSTEVVFTAIYLPSIYSNQHLSSPPYIYLTIYIYIY